MNDYESILIDMIFVPLHTRGSSVSFSISGLDPNW